METQNHSIPDGASRPECELLGSYFWKRLKDASPAEAGVQSH